MVLFVISAANFYVNSACCTVNSVLLLIILKKKLTQEKSLAASVLFISKPYKDFIVVHCPQPWLVKLWLNFDPNFRYRSSYSSTGELKRCPKSKKNQIKKIKSIVGYIIFMIYPTTYAINFSPKYIVCRNMARTPLSPLPSPFPKWTDLVTFRLTRGSWEGFGGAPLHLPAMTRNCMNGKALPYPHFFTTSTNISSYLFLFWKVSSFSDKKQTFLIQTIRPFRQNYLAAVFFKIEMQYGSQDVKPVLQNHLAKNV